MTPLEQQAVEACLYILNRVSEDSDFAWHMMHTEGLSKCIEFVALAKSEDSTSLYDRIHKAGSAAINNRLPRIKELEGEIDELQSIIDQAPVSDFPPQATQKTSASNLEELLHYCRIRGENPTVEAIDAALKGRPLASCLSYMEAT